MNRQLTILAIAPGRSTTGFAVYYDNTLDYYGTVAFGRFKSQQELLLAVDRFLERICRKYAFNELAIRKLIRAQERSSHLIAIHRRLICFAKRNRWIVYELGGQEINKNLTCDGNVGSNNRTRLFIISQYPQLAKFNDDRVSSRYSYYDCLFKAIALGYVHVGYQLGLPELTNERRYGRE